MFYQYCVGTPGASCGSLTLYRSGWATTVVKTGYDSLTRRPNYFNAPIYRYIPFSRFVALLKNGLFVTKASLFEDKLEGLIPIYENEKPEMGFTDERVRNALEWCYVSCWHSEAAESYAMWRIYGQHSEAVCIESSVAQLLVSCFHVPELMTDRTRLYLDLVRYIDPGGLEASEIINALGSLWTPLDAEARRQWAFEGDNRILGWIPFLLYCKHRGYEYEQEVRFTILPRDASVGSINPRSGLFLNSVRPDFIKSVRVSPNAPDWFFGVVTDVVEKYQLACPVLRSGLSSPVRS
jgi:hypothetical protein